MEFRRVDALRTAGFSADDPALDGFTAVSRYSLGPSDSFQALHSGLRAALVNDEERALELVLEVNSAEIHGLGRAAHEAIVKGLAPVLVRKDRLDEAAALLHLTCGTEGGDRQVVMMALLRSAFQWESHPRLGVVALRRLEELASLHHDRDLLDAARYLLALRLHRLDEKRGALRVYANIVISPRSEDAISAPWACASVNFARAISARSPHYARFVVERMLTITPTESDYHEPRAKGSFALSNLESSDARRQERLAFARDIVQTYRHLPWVEGFSPIVEGTPGQAVA